MPTKQYFITVPPSTKCSICISDFMLSNFFYLGRFLKKLAHHQCSSMTKGSVCHINHNYVHTTFYHSSGLTRNWMFNRSIYYVLYLQILRFYFMGQKCLSMCFQILYEWWTWTSEAKISNSRFCLLKKLLLAWKNDYKMFIEFIQRTGLSLHIVVVLRITLINPAW